ncbi:hypothetical protein PHYBOEH_000996 [Phytophthora boehmeriae]|uniref:UBA domain-containing protein n=1 Tax=Phytophthora boehmeriae TaxID=109152 RepID=A0A8T1X704_9STRA|nr:hypothetical protein PHYBOEH_000996 [Phytophthora boehmeriae]
MLVLRVRCVDDGRELLLERHGADEYSVQVAELKRLVLQHRHSFSRSGTVENGSETQDFDIGACFLLLRGQILADADVVDLNALRISDFFVFATDASPFPIGPSSESSLQAQNKEATAVYEVLKTQLQDMGFPASMAAMALQQSNNNLSDAVALLAEGKVKEQSNDEAKEAVAGDDAQEADLLQQYPSIAPLGSMEQFESRELTQLNENPAATLRLLSLPAPRPTSMKFSEQEAQDFDMEMDDWMVTSGANSDGAIDRVRTKKLVAMGFEQGLVQAIYESCGNDEQLTANALLQTLES